MTEPSPLTVLGARIQNLTLLVETPAFYPASVELLDWVVAQPEFAQPLEQIGLELKRLNDSFQTQQQAFLQEAGALLERFYILFPEQRHTEVQRNGEHGIPTVAYHESLRRADDIVAGKDLFAGAQPLEATRFGADRSPVGELLRILSNAFERETKRLETWTGGPTEQLFLDLSYLSDQQVHATAAYQAHLSASPVVVVQQLVQVRRALLGTPRRYASLVERAAALMSIPPLQLNLLVQLRAEAAGERPAEPAIRQRMLQCWDRLLEELSLRLARRQTPGAVQTAAPVIDTPMFLFVTANPADKRLWIDEEMRRIQQELMTSSRRDSWRMMREDAARKEDFLRILHRYQPQLLHFSGHGDEQSLTFVDAEGSTISLAHDQVIEALRIAGGVRVAVFMACFSDGLAERAVEFVDVAIGMTTELDDVVAPKFSAHFYQAIAEGQSVLQAYESVRWAFETDEDTRDEPWTAIMYSREGIDPATLRVTNQFFFPTT